MPRRVPTFKPHRFVARIVETSKKERDAFYSSARWMRLRKAFLAEHPLCEDCLVNEVLTPATIPHHIQERLARPELAMDPANLIALCSPCHTSRHKTSHNKKTN